MIDGESLPEFGYSSETYTQGIGGQRASELYVQDLGLDKWRHVVIEPSFALSNDPLAWVKINRDPVFAHAIQTRRRLIASPTFAIEAPSKDPQDVQAAAICEQALKKMRRFWMGRYNLTDADFRGSAYAAMLGEWRSWQPLIGDEQAGTQAKLPAREWWIPTRLVDVDRYRIRVANVDGRRRLELRSIERDQWEELTRPEWFVKHVYEDAEYAKGYGAGLLDSLYFIWYTKETALELGLQGLEAWAQGRIHVGIEGLREASTGKTNDEIARQWREQVKIWLRDHVLTHDKADEVNREDGPGEGHQMVLDFVRYCDSAFRCLCLGSDLPFGGSGGNDQGGSYARAKEEGTTSDDYLEPSRTLLAESLTDSLVATWYRVNRPNLIMIGLGSAEPGTLKLQRHPITDPEKEGKTIQSLTAAGMKLKQSEAYAKTGYSIPGPNDAVIEAKAPILAPGFGSPFGQDPNNPFSNTPAAPGAKEPGNPGANDEPARTKGSPPQA